MKDQPADYSLPLQEVDMAIVKHKKIKLREVNRHLVCRLCRGYYIDATTIAECLHSFCRSCIIKYLEKNSFCPICEVQIHKTKPYLNLRLDKALQDVVYKLVPGLYHDEMKRRREFYAKSQEQIPVTTPEQCGLEERIIFSPDDSISLSLEYLESDDYETDAVSSQSSDSGDNPDGLSFPQQLGLMKLKTGDGKTSRRESQDIQETSYPKRYLQCPAVVSIFHLKKFIRMKHDLTDKMQVDIVHKRVSLPDHYTLMDVAYIYTWKRSAPMRFFYQICEMKRQKVKIPAPFMKAEECNGGFPNSQRSSCEKGEVRAECSIVNGGMDHKVIASGVVNSEKGPNSSKQTGITNGTVKSVTVDRGKPNEFGEKNNMVVKLNEELTKDRPSAGKISENDVKNKLVKTDLAVSKTFDDRTETEKVKPAVKTSSGVMNENGGERLLLNPVSGQLEPVPSSKTNDKAEVASIVTDKKDVSAECIAKKSTLTDPKSKKSLGVDDGQKDQKKSNVNLLKSFRKERSASLARKDTGIPEPSKEPENSLTITTVRRTEKQVPGEKEKANVSIEIKSEKKDSEYDFDGTSPPSKIIPLQEYSKMAKSQKYATLGSDKSSQNSWMSLQDFRKQMLKEGNTSGPNVTSPPSVAEDSAKKDKRKSVPSLFRINADVNKKGNTKNLNGNVSPTDKGRPKKMSPTIINIKTENLDSNKTEIKIELPVEEKRSSPKSIKLENKEGEYNISRQREEETKKTITTDSAKSLAENKEGEEIKSVVNKRKDSPKELTKRNSAEKTETENPTKKSKTGEDNAKSDSCGAIDLTKAETSPRNCKNPLENLMDMANKSESPKSDENMVEALISAAQKQSIEPLLKIPQYTQNMKNCSGQGSPPLTKNISSNDISQALQFFKDLRSDIKVLEAKSQLSPNSFLEQFMQKSANLEPIQLYQQHIDLIRRLKRQQQMAGNDVDSPQPKQAKLSPTSESKRKSSPETTPRMTEETVQLKSSLERTLSQIQEQMELQSRMVAAQNYKNLPALLQFYNRPPSFCPSPPSPSKSRLKPANRSPNSNSQKSPNSRKSPPSLTSPPGATPTTPLPLAITNPEASFFAAQKYNHLINAGLNSEMTFHQMFQNYLSQQDKMNQIKHGPTLAKKPQVLPTPKSLPDLFFGAAQEAQKKQERTSMGTAQKT